MESMGMKNRGLPQRLFHYRSFIYGATGALSLSLAAMCLIFVHLITIYSVFLLISSAFSAFFILDTTLVKQWGFMIAASVLVAAMSFLVLLFNTHEIWTLVFIFIVSLLIYLVSEKYQHTLAAVKMGMAIFCFAAVQTSLSMMPSAAEALSVTMALHFLYCILGGCLCSLVSATVVHVVFNTIPACCVRWRLNALIVSLFTLDDDQSLSMLASKAQQHLQRANTLSAYRSPVHAHAIESLVLALIDLRRWLSTVSDVHPSVIASIHELLVLCLTITQTGKGPDIMQAYDAFLLGEGPLIKDLASQDKGLSDALAAACHSLRLVCLYSHARFSCPTSFECMAHHLPQKKTSSSTVHPLMNHSEVTIYSKSACRSALALTVAYIITLFVPFQIPAWVLASTNTVMLLNHGDALRKGLHRILGHLVGLGLTLLIGYFVWPYFSTPFFWVPVLMFICAYYCLSNYFVYCVFLIVIIVFLFQGLHLLSPGDYTLIQVTGLRTLDVVVGSVIAVLFAVLFSFRSRGGILVGYTSVLNDSSSAVEGLIKQELPLDLPDVIAYQQVLRLQFNDHYVCLQSSRYQWRRRYVPHRSVLQQQLTNNVSLKNCLSHLLMLSAEYAPTDETLSRLLVACDMTAWVVWVSGRLSLPVQAKTMRRAANNVDDFSQALMALDADSWLSCDQITLHEWLYIKQWRLIFKQFFDDFK